MTLNTIADISLQNYEERLRYIPFLNQNKMASDNFWICSIHIYIFFSPGATIHFGFVFYSPLAGYSILAYEVS